MSWLFGTYSLCRNVLMQGEELGGLAYNLIGQALLTPWEACSFLSRGGVDRGRDRRGRGREERREEKLVCKINENF